MVPTEGEMRASGAVKPSLRTDKDNRNLSGNLSQATKNAMHEAARKERIHGAKK